MARRRGNREGTIYKRGSSWTAQVTLEGKRLTKTFPNQESKGRFERRVASNSRRPEIMVVKESCGGILRG